MITGKKYLVLNSKNSNGEITNRSLTINSRVLKSGETFTTADWAWGHDALESAIDQKRCKEIISKKNNDHSENRVSK